MKIFILSCLFLSFYLLPLSSNAQEIEMIDVVYLTNGDYVKGTIIEIFDDRSVRIIAEKDLIMTISSDDIKRIAEERPLIMLGKRRNTGTKKSNKEPLTYQFKSKAWYNATHFSLLTGSSTDRNNVGIGVHNITGYQFNHWIGIGAGIGLDNYWIGVGELVFPVFAETRGFLNEKKESFYYSIAAGYGFAFKNLSLLVTEAEGGWMAHPSIGYKITTKDNLQLLFDVGAKFQKATFQQETPFQGGFEIRRLTYQRITLRIGMAF